MCQISGVQPHVIEGVYILSLGLSALPYQVFYDITPTSDLLASPRLTISRIDNPSFANE